MFDSGQSSAKLANERLRLANHGDHRSAMLDEGRPAKTVLEGIRAAFGRAAWPASAPMRDPNSLRGVVRRHPNPLYLFTTPTT
jgi:hypothetical protein